MGRTTYEEMASYWPTSGDDYAAPMNEIPRSCSPRRSRRRPDVEDSAVRFGLSETQEARFPRADLGAEQTGLNYLIVKPGRREAFAHRHHEAEELYLVLAGSGRVKLDGELVELEPLDVVRVSPGVTRAFEAGEDGLEVVVFGPHVEGDGETVEGFWHS